MGKEEIYIVRVVVKINIGKALRSTLINVYFVVKNLKAMPKTGHIVRINVS